MARRATTGIPARAIASAPVSVSPLYRAVPSPITTSMVWARGARSPLEPTEPCDGTSGCTPWLSMAMRVSTTSPRAPEYPQASAFALSSRIARTTSSGRSSPTPDACDSNRFRCRVAESSGEITTSANLPNPVVTPYTGLSRPSNVSTYAEAWSILRRASGSSDTGAPPLATATTSAIDRFAPSILTCMPVPSFLASSRALRRPRRRR